MPSDIRVTIVGGGIGGLALANMFEKANISYIILEKATQIKALGSSLGLDATTLPVMEQLGLLEDFYRASNPVRHFNFYNEHLKPIGKVDFSDLEEIGGYPAIILDRPSFYNILLKNLPKDKILYNKRVLSIVQDTEGVTVKCADGSAYLSDIIIGADGAYSAIRQNMYKSLKQKGKLSKSDDKPLGYNQHCLVGVTEPVDPERYPILKRDFADFEIVIPKHDPFYAIYMPLPGNRISWAVIQNVPRGDAQKGEGFRFSEWGPEATMEMANYVRHQPNPFNGTLGDIIDKSPMISKIMLEEKFFKAWYEDRVVLLGDACHKVVPSAGLGANLAILEGVHLCNLLVDIPVVNQRNITKVFQTYYKQRAHIAKAGLTKSRQFGKVMGDRGPVSRLIRKIFLAHMPEKLARASNVQRLHYRPQLHFLPQVPDRGSVKGHPQEPRITF
ncbi:hypothetical protein BCR41DRAFT_346232 [Lobosporangium transversale]|uniref:FAD-binding domain-containing protein n=1 Tax=Lobosporangium transversale TaxID=64571 RepID=A0A1Y2H2H3_9FUNG|nr:hypothetical protein BCR41DRAFT_346232 [Lobosporangium transversale]ORZ27913.1 hypothetical protein BCR41DRAFT_346232 [Lobosporangium transversale]|eukprot:XP_021885616.1 hypothetical protein BCR41DRAFT_346232 [Lobosporangium transversale]